MKTVCVFCRQDGSSDLIEINNAFDLPVSSGSFYKADSWSVFGGVMHKNFGDWHTVHSPLMSIVVAGAWEIQASSGARSFLEVGDILFAFDFHGKGHRSRIASEVPCAVIGVGVKSVPDSILSELKKRAASIPSF